MNKCFSKIAYRTKEEALVQKELANRKYKGLYRIYKCPHCKNYHLAKIKKKEKEG